MSRCAAQSHRSKDLVKYRVSSDVKNKVISINDEGFQLILIELRLYFLSKVSYLRM